jgi:3-carboxy-cis,cis-muconate cycloisomerase
VNCTRERPAPMPVAEQAEQRWSDGLLEAGFGDPQTAELLGWPARVARMVEVEAALGAALARVGIIPPEVGKAIVRACERSRLDLVELAAAAAVAPTPVIPLLRALSRELSEPTSAWLHHGATSQDIIDTAVMLQLREALTRLEDQLLAVADGCAELADRHRGTVMAGRTLGQQAVPVTFGLKAARWLGALDRRIDQLRWVRTRVLVIQLGGAAGTSAVYGHLGLEVADALGAELGLAVPDLPWHAERDRIVELAGMLSGVATTIGSISTDLVLLAQSEIGEVREGAGTGPGSSAMPHKRNPVHAVAARAATRLALGELGVLISVAGEHENERAAGAWQAEWVALPSAVVRTVGSVTRLHAALQGLEVDAERANDNLDRQLGLAGSEALASALTPALGRPRAQQLTAELARAAVTADRPLTEVAGEHAQVTAVLDHAALDAALDKSRSLQLASPLINRAIATHQRSHAPVGTA